jgi:uncharacterized repeat protein (TIGR02543 family)
MNKKFRFARKFAWILAASMMLTTVFAGTMTVSAEENSTAAHTITYDANGGSGSVNSQSAEEGAEAVLAANSFTRTGYVFVGWSANKNAASSGSGNYSSRVYAAGEEYTMGSSDVTLYAIWSTASTTNASFYIRLDGTIPTEPQSHSSSEYTGAITISGAIASGHAYFYTDSTNGVASQLSAVPTDAQVAAACAAKGITYDTTKQYVLWYVVKNEGSWHIDGVLLNKAMANLSYNANAPVGTWSSMPDGSQYAVGSTVTVSSMVPTRQGYEFMGWNTAADGSGESYAANGTFTIQKAVTLYAQWKASNATEYKIERYDAETGALIGNVITRYGTTDSSVSVTEADKSIDGYTYQSGFAGEVTEGTVAADGSLVLKLYFKQTYSVSYDWGTDAPDGVTLPASVSLVSGGSYTVDTTYTQGYTVNVTDADGKITGTWTFSGWNDPNGGTVASADVAITGSWTYQEVGTTGTGVVVPTTDPTNPTDPTTPTTTDPGTGTTDIRRIQQIQLVRAQQRIRLIPPVRARRRIRRVRRIQRIQPVRAQRRIRPVRRIQRIRHGTDYNGYNTVRD